MSLQIEFIPLLIFSLCAIPVSIIDIKSFRIPDWIIVFGSLLIIMYYLLTQPLLILPAVLTGIVNIVLFYIVRQLTKGLGLGDVKFAGFIGLFLGIPNSFIAFGLAAMTGIILSLILVFFHKSTTKQPIPFAPFMTVGTLITGMFCIHSEFIAHFLLE